MGKIVLSIFICSCLHLQARAQKAVLSTESTKVLYRSVDNEVSIAVPGYACAEIVLESADCAIKGEGCRYRLMPGNVPAAVLIIRAGKSRAVIDSMQVPVRSLPQSLSVKIASGKENRGPILEDGPFLISEEGPVPEALFRIVAFEVSLVRKDSILHQCRTKGSHFEAATISAIRQAQAGDRLLLEDIQILAPDQRKRLMSTVVYTFR